VYRARDPKLQREVAIMAWYMKALLTRANA